jgi:hypothetical protein
VRAWLLADTVRHVSEQDLRAGNRQHLKWWALGLAAAVLAATGAVGLVAIASSGDGDGLPDVPSASECEKLAERDFPELEHQAALILEDDSGIFSFADCESGDYPTVEGGTSDRSGAIVQRLRQLGDVEQLENTECLKYLKPSVCGEVWRYSPRDSDKTYVLALETDNKPGEFSISVDRYTS